MPQSGSPIQNFVEGEIVNVDELTPQDKLLARALADPNVPSLYANAFNNFWSPADVTVLLMQSAVPCAVLHLTYPLAKTFGRRLLELVSEFERQSGTKVLGTDELEAATRAYQESQTAKPQ